MKTILDTFKEVKICWNCQEGEGNWDATRYNALKGREYFKVCDVCAEWAGVPDEDGHVSFYLEHNYN